MKKTNSSRPEDLASASVIACLGAWVLARCVLDIFQIHHASLAVGATFLVLLLWIGHGIIRTGSIHHRQLILLPSAMLWAAWTAYRGIVFFPWWLPSILLVVMFSSPRLALPLLAISTTLISTVTFLSHSAANVYWMIGSATIIALMVLLFRWHTARSENALRLQLHCMELTIQAAKVLHVELDMAYRVTAGSASLIEGSGLSRPAEPFQFLELVHVSDRATVTNAIHTALASNHEPAMAVAACECRLTLANGEISWMQARFIRKDVGNPGLIATFISIDGKRQAESALRESQRKLGSQALELSAQFEATKTALHSRQEMERIAQHDLRSPLKSIQATASLLRKNQLLSGKQDHLLISIEQTAGRALAMVTMSLDLYRMEDGTFQFVPETIDLVSIGRQAIAEFGHHARSKNVGLQFDAAEKFLKVVGNPVLTSSIVENLVRNAIEAAPEHSMVTLALYQGARAGLLIHNEGEVDGRIRDKFFEKYATHGKRGGSGLGTYSARLIARAQGGDLTMTSSADKGTLLLLKLNRSPAETDHGSSAAGFHDAFGPSLPGHLIELPTAPEAPAFRPPIDLLVVEDDDHNWFLLLSWLPKHVGARRAINGREAIEALIVKKPDLIVMDIEMPIMGGFEALRRIREMQSSAGEEASIVYAFTGYDDQDTMRKVREAGFDGVLSKPVQQVEFEEVLRLAGSTEALTTVPNALWIEKSFMSAFPTFIASRIELIDHMERAFRAGDASGMRHAAHTLSGSPAIHGFERGIGICQRIVATAGQHDAEEIEKLIVELRRMFYKPVVR